MTRIYSVDAFRVLGIIAIIALHTAVYSGPNAVGNEMAVPAIFNNAERFAVPMFFIISGYFWADPRKTGQELLAKSLAMSRRVLMIFGFWSAVYLVTPVGESFREHGWLGPAKAFYWYAVAPGGWFNATFGGPKIHLWFLPALICACLICGFFEAIRLGRLLPLLAIALFAIGLAGGAYANTPLGFHSGFIFRNGPFFGLIFFVTGCWMRRQAPSLNWLWVGLTLAIGGFALEILEVRFLHDQWGASTAQDFVLAVYPFGLGVALIALSNAKKLQMVRLGSIGHLVLGIYASHYLFIELLRPINVIYRGKAVWDIGYVAIVFTMSLALTYGLSRISLTRRFVT